MAGGNATRLRPASKAVNKHMLPVYDRPMIQHVIESLVAWGVTDIHILINNDFAYPIQQHLEGGAELGCTISYGYERQAISPVVHMRMAESFTQGEPFLLICGDSFYQAPLILDGLAAPHMWVMPLQGFDDFRKYAEVTLHQDRVTAITEHPERQVTGIVQTGAWFFPPDVFERAHRLTTSATDEVQVRNLVRDYVDDGLMRASVLPPQSFLDLGTPEALYQASTIARERILGLARNAA